MSDLDHLPPVYKLLLRETETVSDPNDLLVRLRKLWPELAKQAEWSITEYDYDQAASKNDAPQFEVSAIAGLDPFSINGKCSSLPCRIKTAGNIARSIGLYADKIFLWDEITDFIFRTETLSDDALEWLVTSSMVVEKLRPLLENGLFNFSQPYFSVCQECYDIRHEKMESLSKEVTEQVLTEAEIEVIEDEIYISSPLLYDGLQFTKYVDASKNPDWRDPKNLNLMVYESIHKEVSEDVTSTFETLRRSGNTGAVTFSNSRTGLMAARHTSGDFVEAARIREWEASRSAILPWVGYLTMEQVIELRNDAHDALPKFRKRLHEIMTVGQGESIDNALVQEELRHEAHEVESELRVLGLEKRDAARRREGFLGLTVSLYGYAAEFLAPGASLATLVGLLFRTHDSHTKDAASAAEIESKPGFVLAKAKELVEHA